MMLRARRISSTSRCSSSSPRSRSLGLPCSARSSTYLLTVIVARALVVLGLLVLWRTGLMSFGQALFFGIGAYAVALLSQLYCGLRDAFALVALGIAAAPLAAWALGLPAAPVSRHLLRDAEPRLLDDPLRRTGEEPRRSASPTASPCSSRDLFSAMRRRRHASSASCYWLALAAGGRGGLAGAALLSPRSPARLHVPVRDNEIRVEFLGFSVTALDHLKFVIAGTLAGIGGALAALAVGMSIPTWRTGRRPASFVFITILAGAGSVAAAFLGSFDLRGPAHLSPTTTRPIPGRCCSARRCCCSSCSCRNGVGSLFYRLRRRSKPQIGKAAP